MLKGKTVIIGVTGGIAAYKTANLVSMLVKDSCDVHVIMTKNAINFINPITFETLTGNKCYIDTFDRNFAYDVTHISLAKKADMILVAPATANLIGKLANGIADDMLTTVIMACRKPIYLAPAMNTGMYENPIFQDNLKKLEHFGMHIIDPDTGRLACGDVGSGKMPSEEVLRNYVLKEIAYEKDLSDKRILITAGATREAIDPVRFITNHSTGKMGFAIANQAMLRGAKVTLVYGKTTVKPPMFVNQIEIISAQDMYERVMAYKDDQDAIIMSAAVADYTPKKTADHKIKKMDGDHVLELGRTNDILAALGSEKREDLYLCGFCMETENLIENARKKLIKKNADLIVANSLCDEGAGFGVDTNLVTLIGKDFERMLPLMPKTQVADEILDVISKGSCN
ncbi:MAG: bifunctional phosphopantothenoylcysteine decarboxylase/phosphopantothenate--cysteine ligase CoaBC [Clostridia bacterium]|nr:bifunctional phosphopantothenoylcysteine decarboxylase/phosphopantothenate--cysteine ligase CoaBC [Clostridia bacterium]